VWKATLAGLRAHRVRLGLTALSIVLGVAFVAATLIFTDTLNNTFDRLFSGVYGKISVQVRHPSPVKDQFGAKTFVPMPESILGQVASLPGVAASEGSVSGFAQLVGKNGKAIGTNGAPTIGSNYGQVRAISGFTLALGHAPQGPAQVVIDKNTADGHGFHVGDPIEILFQGPPERFTLVGIVKFGNANGLGGATVAQFDLPTAQRVLNRVGTFDAVNLLAKPGVSSTQLQAEVQPVLPSGYDAITGTQLAKENAQNVNRALSFFTDFLLVFALISLFVGSFIILNTFSILVAQRTREYALLRALGASRRQVLVATLGEAGFVGLLASAVGVGAGTALAVGLQAIFKASGASFPSYGLVVSGRTVVVGLLVGTAVSLLASLNPARRASRVAPVQALGAAVVEPAGTPARRAALGGILLAGGLALMMVGLFVSHHNQAVEVGVGIAVTFLGVATLAPFLARQSASLLGRPLHHFSGVAGVLARQNAMRNPRRTASTASALMIGLALVTMFAVFGQSAKASLKQSVEQDFLGDFVVKTPGANFGPFSPTVEPIVAAVPGVGASSPERIGQAVQGSSTTSLLAVNPNTISQVIRVELTSGSLSSLGRGEVLVEKNTAAKKGWKVGSPATFEFAKTGRQTLIVGGTFKNNPLLGPNYIVSTSVFDANYTDQLDVVVAVKAAAGSDVAAVESGINQAIAGYPNLVVNNAATVEKDQSQQINQILTIIDAMLALAIIIAVFGIINTLVLSVLERTRELGLLRAVGMSRRQVRRMIRGESVVIALFGAALGVVVGVGFGAALSQAVIVANSGGLVSVPVSSLILYVVLAIVFGVVAAIWPARKAARTNLLAALVFE
jgi:putative ABC transport system permease protein